MDNFRKDVIKLIKSALTGEKYELGADLDFAAVTALSKKHQIQSLIYYGALNCGVSNALPEMQDLFLKTCGFISVSTQQMYELGEIFKKFDENKVEYMPLKGTVLKSLYPKSEMRTMSDADILIKTDQYDVIKPIMEGLGFAEKIESDHELVWTKSKVTIELHKRLIPSYNKDYYAYFGDGWQLGRKLLNSDTRYDMSNEDKMVYLFTHYAKHYRDAGIGIKHIVDLWVYKKSVDNLDDEYVLTELKKLQLDKFYQNTMHTLSCWFEDSCFDEIAEFITCVIFNSGVYGTHEAHILSAALKTSKSVGTTKKARFKRIINAVFLPCELMSKRYPILEKAPVLLPIMWVVRGFTAFFFRRKNVDSFNADLKTMSDQKVDEYQRSLNFVGLDFNFKE